MFFGSGVLLEFSDWDRKLTYIGSMFTNA